MIETEYGLSAERNALSSEFKQNLFDTKDIDLEGKYINIRNLNGLLKEILDTLYEYYKGNVLTFTEGVSYKKGAVVQYNSNLYYVLNDTDPTSNPEDQSNAYKLLTPNVAQMIEDARVLMKKYVDDLNSEVNLELEHLNEVDTNLDTKIELNTQRFENLLTNTNAKFDETLKEFEAIREVLKEHGIINDQEDNFISELQRQVQDIIAVNQRQDTQIAEIQKLDETQNTRLTNVESKNTEQDTRLSSIDNTLTEHAQLEARDKGLIDQLREDHDTLRTDHDSFKSAQNLTNSGVQNKLAELDVIDTNLRNDVDTNTASIERIDDFTSTMRDDLDKEILEQSTNFSDLDTRVETLKSDLVSQTEKEESDRLGIQTQIDNIDTLNTEQNGRLDTLETHDSDHETRVHSLEERADTNDTDITGLKSEDKLLRKFLETLEENVGTNNSIITDIQEKLENLDATTTENNTTLVQVTDDHTTDINQIKEVNNTQDTRISTLENKLANGGLNQAALNELNNKITTEVGNAETRLNQTVVDSANNTKKELYQEITGTGKEGEYLQLKYNGTAGRNEVQSTPLITFSKIAASQEQVDALKLEPVGMSTVFSTWYRFSHWWGDENLNSGVHLDTRNAWSYDPNTKMIKSNRNSPVYSAFISPRKLANWYLKVLAYGGGDGDNDGILINLAYMKGEDGHEHTIDLVRAVMGSGNGVYQDSHGMDYYWSIVYDYRLNTQFELANNTYIQPKSGGWGTQYCCFSAQRTKTNFKCYTSQIGGRTEEVDPKSEINWTLPLTKPSNYSDAMYANLKIMCENPAQMGVGAHSQNGLFTILDQKYIFDDEKIYDFVSNTIWEYDEPTRLWNAVGKCSDMYDGFVYSRSTEDLYYIDNGKAINLNNASTLITENRVQELIDQLAQEVQDRDAENLQSSKDYSDTKNTELETSLKQYVVERIAEMTTSAEFTELNNKVSTLETENTNLKNRVQTLEDFISKIDIQSTTIDGVEYQLVSVKKE